MLEAFIEFLDGMYWEGYAEEFENNNPTDFYNQFRDFNSNYSIPI